MKFLLSAILFFLFPLIVQGQEEFEVLNSAYLEGNANEIAALIELDEGFFIAGNMENLEGSVKIDNENISSGTAFFLKVDSKGKLLWKKIVHGGHIEKAKIDENGQITLLGRFGRALHFEEEEGLEEDINGKNFVSRHTSDGDLIWSKSFGGEDGYTTSMNVDIEGNTYIWGTYQDGFKIDERSFYDRKINIRRNGEGAFLFKLNRYGGLEWAGNDFHVSDMIFSPEGDLIITGVFKDSLNINGEYVKGTDAILPYIAKISTSGIVHWVEPLITWRNTRSVILSQNEDNFLISGVSEAFAINYKKEKIEFKTQGGIFYFILDYNGNFISAKPIGTTSRSAFAKFLRSIILTDKNDVYLSADFSSTRVYINEKHLETPWYNFKTVMKFSPSGILDKLYLSKSTGISPGTNMLFSGKESKVWFGTKIRDSVTVMNKTFVPKNEFINAGFLLVQIEGDESLALSGPLTNTRKATLPKQDFWVDQFDEIDNFGLKFTFPYQNYAELGQVGYKEEGGHSVRFVASEIDVSHLIEITRPFKPRNPEDGHRLGSDIDGITYDKEQYGSYAFSLVRGFSGYSGTGLLWKKSNRAYRLVKIYPDFAGGGLYATPSLAKYPDDDQTIVVRAVGGDAGDVWGNIYYYEVVNDNIKLIDKRRVTQYSDIED